MQSLKARLRLSIAAFGLLAAGSAFGQTLTMTDVSANPGAAAQSIQLNYTAGGNVSIIITNINLADANAIVTGLQYQHFNNGTTAFVACDGTFRTAGTIGGIVVRIACASTGAGTARYTIQSLDPTTDVLPSFTNLARAQFTIGAGATAGQTATFSYAPNCTAGQFPNVDNCTEFTTTAAARVNGTLTDTGDVTVSAPPTNRTLSYNPTTGTTIAFAAGVTAGTAAPNQTIVVTATGDTGTATLTGCATTGPAGVFSVAPTDLTFGDADPNPQNLTVGCTYPTTNATGTLTCSQTNAGGTATNVSWPLSCPAPNANPTIASNPASGSTFSVGGASVGSQGTATIDLSATGGSGAGTTTISCTSTGNVLIAAAPGTPAGQGPVAQTVTGANQPTDLSVGVVLTTAAQTPAGTITCTV
ncbi:MAG TPA: hypothetical protein VNB06_23995, partial [Thermoanaerobaculia bacterium]|nr:hypothetical protein [Thermoanaerobaculia bacterium]